MARRNVFDDLDIDVLGKLYRSLGSTRGAYPSAFTRERDEKRVLASIAVYPSGTVSEDAAV